MTSIRSSPLPFNNSIAIDALFWLTVLFYTLKTNRLIHGFQKLNDMIALYCIYNYNRRFEEKKCDSADRELTAAYFGT